MDAQPGAVRDSVLLHATDAALFSSTEQQVLDLAWREAHHLRMRQSRIGRLIDRLARPAGQLPLANRRLEALRQYAIALCMGQRNGKPEALLEAGFDRAQIAVLEFLFGEAPAQRAAA